MKSDTQIKGGPLLLLRLEGLIWFLGSIYAFHYVGGSWWLFTMLFFVPDLSFLGYLFGTRVGALCYNAMHSNIGPLMLGFLGVLLHLPLSLLVALIWFSHVTFDRMLGFGLKYASGFTHTHLGIIKNFSGSKKARRS